MAKNTTLPFTLDELNNLDTETILFFYKNKSVKLYPFCLIGMEFNIANEILKNWNSQKNNKTEFILLKNNEGFIMENEFFEKSFWYCELDANNTIVDLYRPYHYDY
jgi:hypothetical protein